MQRDSWQWEAVLRAAPTLLRTGPPATCAPARHSIAPRSLQTQQCPESASRLRRCQASLCAILSCSGRMQTPYWIS